MALYRLLLRLIPNNKGKEDQEEVDLFIVQEFGEPTAPSPHRPRVQETIFTRIRNEVAHVRPNVDFTATRIQLVRCLDRLPDIVKRAIEKRG